MGNLSELDLCRRAYRRELIVNVIIFVVIVFMLAASAWME